VKSPLHIRAEPESIGGGNIHMNKRTKNILIASTFIVILLLTIGIFGGFNNLFAISGMSADEYIQSPVFMYYECGPASAPVDSPFVSMPTGSSGWITSPKNTDSWDLYLQQTEQTSWYSNYRRIVYQICNDYSGCQSQVFKTTDYFTAKSGYPTLIINGLNQYDKVFVNYQYSSILGWKDSSGGFRYYARYKPFILWKVSMFQGGKTEYTSALQGCTFPSGKTNFLIDAISNIKGISLSQTSSSDYVLEPYKTRNFIDTFVPLSKSNVNFVTYGGQDGYCLNRVIYKIGTITTNAGTSKVVDVSLNSVLANVECCPGETEPTRKCSSTFKWETLSGSECSLMKPCAGVDWFPSGTSKQLVRYDCVNGFCKPQTKIVECTNNNDCNGKYCDTKTYICVELPVPTPTTSPNGTIVKQKCISCDAFAKSKLLSWSKVVSPCEPKGVSLIPPSLGQTAFTCWFSFFKFLMLPIVFILTLLFGYQFLESFDAIKDKKWLVWIFAIVLTSLVTLITYFLFWVGVIVFVIFIIAKMIIGGTLGKIKTGVQMLR
jgi:hypothetical protein